MIERQTENQMETLFVMAYSALICLEGLQCYK